MGTLSWTCPIKDDEGYEIGDVEVEVDFDVSADGQDVEVVGIWTERGKRRPGRNGFDAGSPINMLNPLSGTTVHTLGVAFKSQLESDERFLASAVKEDGFAYVGRGGNDPDGRMVRELA